MLSFHRLTTAAVTAALLAVPAAAHARAADAPATPPRTAAEIIDRVAPDNRYGNPYAVAPSHPVNAPGATAVDSASRPSLPGPPTWPVNPQPIVKAQPVHASDGGGLDWTATAFGIAAALALAAAGATRLRIRRGRTARAAT